MKKKYNKKIFRVITDPNAYGNIRGQFKILRDQGFQISLVSPPGEYLSVLKNEGIDFPTFSINIERPISIKRDFISLLKLISLFYTEKPHIVHSSTPKAGLLTALASFVARVPVRMHTFTGQRWAVLNTGFLKRILIFFDKLICSLNTIVYADSPSQIDFLIKHKIVKREKVRCLHKGSLGGVELERFSRDNFPNRKKAFISELSLNPECKILIYVGRVVRDKGLEELLDVFTDLASDEENLELFIVGPYEKKLDPIGKKFEKALLSHRKIHYFGRVHNPEYYLAGADLFCIPSYREGFPTVVLEAAALGVPAIGTKIPGLVDAIKHGETGLLVKSKDRGELKKGIQELIHDEEKLRYLGTNARNRAQKYFDYKVLADCQIKEYLTFFNHK